MQREICLLMQKLHTRNSLTKALLEMGIAPAVSKTDNETTHWQERERGYLKGLCLERGIIVDREKRYAVYEKKIDKVLAAGKPVAKELAVIRKNAKQLPSILGCDPSVKISEKDFNRLMDMAQASGTLEKLNKIYDRELEHMQGS